MISGFEALGLGKCVLMDGGMASSPSAVFYMPTYGIYRVQL
jgi:hypothetical protein